MNIPIVKLKNTELEVSRLCFGTMTFGKPLDQAGATQLVNRCIEAGINFFDTANVYQLGVAETMLGHAIKGKRERLVIASKVFFKVGEEADQQGLSRKAILRNIDESLKRLVLRPLDYVTKLVSGLLACELPLDSDPVAIHATVPGPSLLAQASDVSDSAFA